MSYIFSVTRRCNLHCKTCNIWQEKDNPEFTAEEFGKIIASIGRSAEWITITGGEPFLREDLIDIFKYIQEYSKPKVITMATNGTLYDRTPELVKRIVSLCPKSRIVIYVSIDGARSLHDFIRGMPGCYDNAIKTFTSLKEIRAKYNLDFTIGINTVVSKFNINRFTEIYKEITELKPDSFLVEMAQHRDEFKNSCNDIVPDWEEIKDVLTLAYNFGFNCRVQPVKSIKILRQSYYQHLKNILTSNKADISCYAGIASAYIMPNTDVWVCAVKKKLVGNLRENGYNLKKIWQGRLTQQAVAEIHKERCFCTLANMSNTNVLCNLGRFSKFIWSYLRRN